MYQDYFMMPQRKLHDYCKISSNLDIRFVHFDSFHTLSAKCMNIQQKVHFKCKVLFFTVHIELCTLHYSQCNTSPPDLSKMADGVPRQVKPQVTGPSDQLSLNNFFDPSNFSFALPLWGKGNESWTPQIKKWRLLLYCNMGAANNFR